MPTIGSVTKTIRFNPTDLGLIESKMKKEDTTFNNAVHLLISQNGGTPIEKKPAKTDYESIVEMAGLMRVEPDTLLKAINELLESGQLYYQNGKLINPMYEELESICKEKKINIENIIYKVIRDIENGK